MAMPKNIPIIASANKTKLHLKFKLIIPTRMNPNNGIARASVSKKYSKAFFFIWKITNPILIKTLDNATRIIKIIICNTNP